MPTLDLYEGIRTNHTHFDRNFDSQSPFKQNGLWLLTHLHGETSYDVFGRFIDIFGKADIYDGQTVNKRIVVLCHKSASAISAVSKLHGDPVWVENYSENTIDFKEVLKTFQHAKVAFGGKVPNIIYIDELCIKEGSEQEYLDFLRSVRSELGGNSLIFVSASLSTDALHLDNWIEESCMKGYIERSPKAEAEADGVLNIDAPEDAPEILRTCIAKHRGRAAPLYNPFAAIIR